MSLVEFRNMISSRVGERGDRMVARMVPAAAAALRQSRSIFARGTGVPSATAAAASSGVVVERAILAQQSAPPPHYDA